MTTEVPNANFPQKLFTLMENEHADVVCWSDHGLSFRVVDQDKFSEEVVPKYFRHTKMTSFQRQLNLYGFRRVTKGEDVGAYYHPKFQKGRRDLIAEIKRLPGKNAHFGGGANGLREEKLIGLSDLKYIPHECNLVEIPGANNRTLVSRLTQKLSNLPGTSVLFHPPSSSLPTAAATNSPLSTSPFHLVPSYVAENSVQFTPQSTTNDSSAHSTTTVHLTREAEQTTAPLLQRNFSVSSTFDEEYRLPISNDEVENVAPTKPSTSTNGGVGASAGGAGNPSSNLKEIILSDKPSLPVRDESESWVKLGALDQLHDMDPFDIDTVFE